MKRLQVTAPGEFEIHEVPEPIAAPGEAVIRIDAVTTCPQWDLHLKHNSPMFIGHRFVYPYTPGQPGHEATGEVVALGSEVTTLKLGDRVSVWRDGGHDLPGCYAQFVARPAEHLMKVPDGIEPHGAAPLELAMCVAVSISILRELDAIRGQRFAISGLGPAGLVAAQMARAEGAAEIIGFDPVPSRRDAGLALGLTSAADPAEWPADRHVDSAIDCHGGRASVEFLMDRALSTVALFGVPREDYHYAPRHWGRGLRLCGYRPHNQDAADYAVSLMARGVLDLRPLSTHHLPLESYGEGIELLERQEAIKVCFHPWS